MGKIKGWERIYGKINSANGITYRNMKTKKLLTIQRDKSFSNKKTFVQIGNKELVYFPTERSAIMYKNKYMRNNPNG